MSGAPDSSERTPKLFLRQLSQRLRKLQDFTNILFSFCSEFNVVNPWLLKHWIIDEAHDGVVKTVQSFSQLQLTRKSWFEFREAEVEPQSFSEFFDFAKTRSDFLVGDFLSLRGR